MTEESGEIKQLFTYEHHASRIELFVRILYWIAIGVVLWVYGFIAGICMIIQWFVILILGHRNEGLGNFIKGYLEYSVYVTPYVSFMTDNRPGVMPRPVKIYQKEEVN